MSIMIYSSKISGNPKRLQKKIFNLPNLDTQFDAYYLWTPGTSTTRLVVGVISAMVEKELGERNFGFDWLKGSVDFRLM